MCIKWKLQRGVVIGFYHNFINWKSRLVIVSDPEQLPEILMFVHKEPSASSGATCELWIKQSHPRPHPPPPPSVIFDLASW